MIIAIHNQNPGTGPEAGYTRYQVGSHWVDATTEPTLAEVDAQRNPPKTKAQRVAAHYAASGQSQLLVQMCIDVIEDKAKTLAPGLGMTFEQGKAAFYASNKSYRECRIIKQGQIDIETGP